MSNPVKFTHIMVIDPAVKTAEVDCFNFLVARSKLPLTYHLPALVGMESLKTAPRSIAGILVLGSAASVHDNLPWQRPLEDWLRSHLEGGTPVMGFCYGHQMIAHTLGGKVGFLNADKTKRLGFHRISLAPDRLWGERPREGRLFMSHQEIVTHCPPGMRVVGRSNEVAIEALTHERWPVWSFQAHPEATPSFLKSHGAGCSEESPEAFGSALIDSFLDYAALRALG